MIKQIENHFMVSFVSFVLWSNTEKIGIFEVIYAHKDQFYLIQSNHSDHLQSPFSGKIDGHTWTLNEDFQDPSPSEVFGIISTDKCKHIYVISLEQAWLSKPK